MNTIDTKRKDFGRETELVIKMDMQEAISTPQFLEVVLEEAAKKIADHMVHTCFKEIMERISPEAIANMAIAKAGAAINKTLQEDNDKQRKE